MTILLFCDIPVYIRFFIMPSCLHILALCCIFACSLALAPCPGDTRSDRRCNWDSTHRVCAKIGLDGTSFWRFTGQRNWCNTRGYYWGPFGRQPRCPREKPSWCICKWAAARWIEGEGCNDDVQFNCEATDVCNLKSSYSDFGVNLRSAHDCIRRKCPNQWIACPESEANILHRGHHHSRHGW